MAAPSPNDTSPYSPPDEAGAESESLGEASSAASIGSAIFVVFSALAALAYWREMHPEDPMNIYSRRPWNYVSAALMGVSVMFLVVAFFRGEQNAERAARFAIIVAVIIAMACQG